MLIQQKLEYSKNFTDNEKNVAQYLLDHADDLSQLSISTIAKETYTSASTTVRLAQKLGYKGWKELRAAYIEEWHYLQSHFIEADPNIPFSNREDNHHVAKKVAGLLTESIKDTYELIDYNTLKHFVEMLDRSETVNIFGLGFSVSIAYDFQLKMLSIGKRVDIINNIDDIPYYVTYMQNNACNLFISYSGETTELIKAMKQLKRKKKVLAITSIGHNTMDVLSDYCLHITTREKLIHKVANYTSIEAIHYLLDLLYSSLFALHFDEYWKQKNSLAAKTDYDRYSNVSVIRENQNDEE